MNLVLEWIESASRVWWQYVAHTTWQAAVVGLGLLWLVRWAGERWPAPLRYALLVLALLKFACPPLLPIPAPVFGRMTLFPSVFSAPAERKPAAAPVPDRDGSTTAAGTGALAPLRSAPQAGSLWAAQLGSVSWMTWLMLIHAAGAAIIARSIHRQASRLRAFARLSASRLDPELGTEYRDLAIQLGVYRIPPVTICDAADAPMAFGWKTPRIVLPASVVRGLSPVELKAVLAHELAHCQRGDLWLVWVQVALFALWWFHPVVWLLNRHLNDAREDCCDDVVLQRRVISNDAYCDLLLRAASAAITPASAVAFGQPLHPLGRRLARISAWTFARRQDISRTSAVVVFLGAVVLLPGVRLTEAGRPPGSQAGAPVPAAVPVKVAARGPVSSMAVRSSPRMSAAAARTARPAVPSSGRVSARQPLGSGRAPNGVVASSTPGVQPLTKLASGPPAVPRRDFRPGTPGILTASGAAYRPNYFVGWSGGQGLNSPRPRALTPVTGMRPAPAFTAAPVVRTHYATWGQGPRH